MLYSKDNTFRNKLIHTPTQIVWSDIKYKYLKEMIYLTNLYSNFIDDLSNEITYTDSFPPSKRAEK